MKTRNPCRPVVALMLACLLGACGSMAPEYRAPTLPVASRYPTAVDADEDTATAATALPWREQFTDPVMLQLIEQALANNRDLRTAALRVRESQALYGVQRAERFPNLGLSTQSSRSRTPADLSYTGRVRVAGQYQVALGVSAWELDLWGRVQSLQDAALHSFLASEATQRAAQISLVRQVADAYLSLRELDERITLAGRAVVSREESLRIFRRRVEEGASSRLELTQVQTLAEQARLLVAQLEQSRAQQAQTLVMLVGVPGDLPPSATPWDDGAVRADLRAGLPSALLTHRPDIQAAEQRLRAAHANIGAARAAFFPRIALTSQVGTASAALDGLFTGGSRSWSFTPSVTLPIFDGGGNRNSLDLAQVRSDVAVTDYEKTVQSAFREVADALSARRWIAEQVLIQQAAQAAQSERARLARLRFDHGAAPFLEVLDAQRDLLSAEQQTVQLRRALLSAHVSLYAALGGGAPALAQDHAAATQR